MIAGRALGVASLMIMLTMPAAVSAADVGACPDGGRDGGVAARGPGTVSVQPIGGGGCDDAVYNDPTTRGGKKGSKPSRPGNQPDAAKPSPDKRPARGEGTTR